MTMPEIRSDMPMMKSLRENWGWFLAMGIALVVLGSIAIGSAFIATIAVVQVLGALLFVGGVMQTVHAFWSRGWKGFAIHLLSGLLYLVFGWLMITRPLPVAGGLTILIVAFLLVGGLVRIVMAIQLRSEGWFWMLLSGIINILLALLILDSWPESALWVIGLFVGIEMLFNGFGWIMISLAVRGAEEPQSGGTPSSA